MPLDQLVKILSWICTIKVLEIRIRDIMEVQNYNWYFPAWKHFFFLFSPEGWSGQGCQTRIINSNLTECVCNHLTHSGVLMDYSYSDDKEVSVDFFESVNLSLAECDAVFPSWKVSKWGYESWIFDRNQVLALKSFQLEFSWLCQWGREEVFRGQTGET